MSAKRPLEEGETPEGAGNPTKRAVVGSYHQELTDDQIRECHEEKIHQCGAIQASLGALVVVMDCGSLETQNICMASGNAGTVFQRSQDEIMSGNMTVEQLLGEGLSQDVMSFRNSARTAIVKTTDRLIVALHKIEDYIVLEAEEKIPATTEEAETFSEFMSEPMRKVQECRSIQKTAEILVQELKALSGYSRLMIYRFDRDYNGVVIAEAKDDDLEPFLHLHYPASDIPEQARRLYTKNWIRLIIANGQISPIYVCGNQPPGSTPPETLDLTMSRYRAVSPVHIRYLENMGVKASLSISLVVNNKLWGMVACHDYTTPRRVSLTSLCMYEVLARSFSIHISSIEKTEIDALTQENSKRLEALLQSDDSELPETVARHSGELMDIFKAQGFLLAKGSGRVLSVQGKVPAQQYVGPFLEWLKGNCNSSTPVFVTECLAKKYPPGEDFADVGSGVLCLSLIMDHYLCLFRPEYVRTINWGGKPDEKGTIVETGPGGKYFGPRRSFALYSQELKQHSAVFTREEEGLAENLARVLMVRQRQTMKMIMDRDAAHAAIAAQAHFMSRVSRQLQSPMNGILGFLGLLSETRLSHEQIDYISTLTNCSDHLVTLTNDLLDFSRHYESFVILDEVPFDLHQACRECLDEVAARFPPERRPPMRIDYTTTGVPPDSWVMGDKERFKIIVVNLLLNAVAATDASGSVTTQVYLAPSTLFPGRLTCTVQVVDTGCGIPEEHLNEIFSAFNRPIPHTPGASGERRLGPGMGLSVSRKLAISMSGDIRARSTVGRGSTFTLTCVIGRATPGTASSIQVAPGVINVPPGGIMPPPPLPPQPAPAPANQDDDDAAPANQDDDDAAPANQGDDDAAPANQDDDDAAPANEDGQD